MKKLKNSFFIFHFFNFFFQNFSSPSTEKFLKGCHQNDLGQNGHTDIHPMLMAGTTCQHLHFPGTWLISVIDLKDLISYFEVLRKRDPPAHLAPSEPFRLAAGPTA